MLYLVLTVFIVIAALLMCFIVLIQNSKGGGLASGFSSSNQIMGVRKTTDFLEKATWGLAIAMVVLSVATAYVLPKASDADGSIIMQQAQQEERTNPMSAPAFDASSTGVNESSQPAETAPVSEPAE